MYEDALNYGYYIPLGFKADPYSLPEDAYFNKQFPVEPDYPELENPLETNIPLSSRNEMNLTSEPNLELHGFSFDLQEDLLNELDVEDISPEPNKDTESDISEIEKSDNRDDQSENISSKRIKNSNSTIKDLNVEPTGFSGKYNESKILKYYLSKPVKQPLLGQRGKKKCFEENEYIKVERCWFCRELIRNNHCYRCDIKYCFKCGMPHDGADCEHAEILFPEETKFEGKIMCIECGFEYSSEKVKCPACGHEVLEE